MSLKLYIDTIYIYIYIYIVVRTKADKLKDVNSVSNLHKGRHAEAKILRRPFTLTSVVL